MAIRVSKDVRCPVCGGDGLFTRVKDPDPYSKIPVDGEPCWACEGRGFFGVGRLDISLFGRKFSFVDPVKGYPYIDPTLCDEIVPHSRKPSVRSAKRGKKWNILEKNKRHRRRDRSEASSLPIG